VSVWELAGRRKSTGIGSPATHKPENTKLARAKEGKFFSKRGRWEEVLFQKKSEGGRCAVMLNATCM
jgi:hypothetical protein